MTFQTQAPIAHRSLPVTTRQAREIINFREYGLDLNPRYQRGSVWTTEQRVALIRSWLAGVPVPAVTINDRSRDFEGDGEFTYAVIDGKQRIETAIEWLEGRLAVPASWFTAEDVEQTVETDDGPYVTFEGLSKSARLDFVLSKAKLPMIETRVTTIAEEAALYVLLERSGTPQTEADVQRAQTVSSGAVS